MKKLFVFVATYFALAFSTPINVTNNPITDLNRDPVTPEKVHLAKNAIKAEFVTIKFPKPNALLIEPVVKVLLSQAENHEEIKSTIANRLDISAPTKHVAVIGANIDNPTINSPTSQNLMRIIHTSNEKTAQKNVDPIQKDPTTIDSAQIDPAQIDPAQIDPAQIDPTKINPSKTHSAQIDPAKLDPAQKYPANRDPTKFITKTLPIGKLPLAKTTDPTTILPPQTNPQHQNKTAPVQQIIINVPHVRHRNIDNDGNVEAVITHTNKGHGHIYQGNNNDRGSNHDYNSVKNGNKHTLDTVAKVANIVAALSSNTGTNTVSQTTNNDSNSNTAVNRVSAADTSTEENFEVANLSGKVVKAGGSNKVQQKLNNNKGRNIFTDQ